MKTILTTLLLFIGLATYAQKAYNRVTFQALDSTVAKMQFHYADGYPEASEVEITIKGKKARFLYSPEKSITTQKVFVLFAKGKYVEDRTIRIYIDFNKELPQQVTGYIESKEGATEVTLIKM